MSVNILFKCVIRACDDDATVRATRSRGAVAAKEGERRGEREKGVENYYTLSFDYRFEYTADEVWFAHAVPYTYTCM